MVVRFFEVLLLVADPHAAMTIATMAAVRMKLTLFMASFRSGDSPCIAPPYRCS